jgi:hypothetical protein
MKIRAKQVSRDNERMQVYWICQERVEEMMQLAQVALRAREEGGYDPMTGCYSKPYTDTYRYTVLSSDAESSVNESCLQGDRPAETVTTDSTLL